MNTDKRDNTTTTERELCDACIAEITTADYEGGQCSNCGHELEARAMSETRIQLEQVTEQILDRMQAEGWYSGASREPRFDRPAPRDINNGECEEWVMLAMETVGGEECWLDTFKTTADWPHCVLRLNGKYYDSLHLDGCRTLKEFVKEARIAANEERKRARA